MSYTTTFRNTDIQIGGEGKLLLVEDTPNQLVIQNNQILVIDRKRYLVIQQLLYPLEKLTIVQLSEL